LNNVQYVVSGLAWNDHEFSSGELDQNQIGWDWFSLQFEDGRAVMLFQLRERGGGISDTSSGTWIADRGIAQRLNKLDFKINVSSQWQSPHTNGTYPSSWKITIDKEDCLLNIHPWMADQELTFLPITYWEGAVHFEGSCRSGPVHGNGYIELTGYAGNLPMP
jgi:predicted secreted hydrolase